MLVKEWQKDMEFLCGQINHFPAQFITAYSFPLHSLQVHFFGTPNVNE
jgi:hypothetical protein